MALVIYLAMLIMAIIIACVLIVTQGFWAGDVVLCCVIALYELSVLQLVLLAILRRRDIHSATRRQEDIVGRSTRPFGRCSSFCFHCFSSIFCHSQADSEAKWLRKGAWEACG